MAVNDTGIDVRHPDLAANIWVNPGEDLNGNGVAGAAAFSAGNGTVVPPGLGVNPGNTCNAAGLLNNLTQCSNNKFPDVIEKVALDPGWPCSSAAAAA